MMKYFSQKYYLPMKHPLNYGQLNLRNMYHWSFENLRFRQVDRLWLRTLNVWNCKYVIG
ncbi:hypothetical protein WN51_08152 [Melipona quadrifasciata]|uniref:Uncharacterized protein n=1 Tax=Melipona quadrifasciata TaxID=166423 RepID=A0A0M8ZNL4_9HYME|nr:hypothetical protein WN51_08152 [Melipona quadrifasciata]